MMPRFSRRRERVKSMDSSAAASSRAAFVVLGNHLFPLSRLGRRENTRFFMAEDLGLCTYVRHHKLKIVLFLASMRAYADELRSAGHDVTYLTLDERAEGSRYEDALAEFVARERCGELVTFEIEDRFFADRIDRFASEHRLKRTVLESPMFLTPRAEFAAYLDDAGKPFMASFYQRQRRRLKVLLDDRGAPVGGRWSFDGENRRRLPSGVAIPPTPAATPSRHVRDVCELVERRFADHPGETKHFWLPTTRDEALAWLDAFVRDRLALFGDYEDALSRRDPVLFHSVLAPVLNLGLITPEEVLRRVLDHARAHGTPINSVEGFVRQIIGWREFVRGVDHHFGKRQSRENFWNHRRKLTEHWRRASTGLPPLDDAIAKAVRLGWTHHIERLMVLGNLMLLCEIEPGEAYRWFMEMHVDSSDWVMGPNVYGMALFSDGGVFATKPYICGSNYLLRMSDYKRGPWCDVIDGLYWRFVDRHRAFFAANPRLSVMTRSLDRLDAGRRASIFAKAEAFLEKCTRS